MSKSKVIKVIMVINIFVLVASFVNLYIINKKLEPVFTLKVTTDQFVMTKSEFDKFKKDDMNI